MGGLRRGRRPERHSDVVVELDAALRFRLLLRSLAIQGSWNYRTLIGAGVGFALIPVLARLHRGDREGLARSLGRHTDFFNSHPYLATVAIAALARLEMEGAEAEQIDRFKSVLVGPLGTLGDRLVWARWRPLCLLLAILVYLAGAPWWAASALFLVLYNVVHLWLRLWGLDVGWREGRDVARVLMGSTLRRLPERLTIPLAAVGGALLPPIALAMGGSTDAGPLSIIAIAFALAVLGFWRPVLAGRAAVVALVLGSAVFTALGRVVW